MSNGDFLKMTDGRVETASALHTSSGASDADRLVKLNASGLLDGSFLPPSVLGGLPRGYIHGLQLQSMSGNVITVTAGVCRSAADDVDYELPAAIEKNLGAAFSKGDTGGGLGASVSLPASGTIHIFAISEISSSDPDIYADTSVTGANVPSGWIVRRRIFSLLTSSGANLRNIEQFGDAFNMDQVTSLNISSGFPETPTNVSLDVPNGIRVRPILLARAAISVTATASWFILPADAPTLDYLRITVLAASNMDGQSPIATLVGGITTNTSRQISHYVNGDRFSNLQLRINGWFDTRGRDE